MMGALTLSQTPEAIMALSADVRRVVTTIDSKDKAVVLLDGVNPHTKVRPQAQTVSRLLWVTDQTPADLSGSADRAGCDRYRYHAAARRHGLSHRRFSAGNARNEQARSQQHAPKPWRRRAQARIAASPSSHAPHAHGGLRRRHGRRDRHAARRFGNSSQGGRRIGATGHASRPRPSP